MKINKLLALFLSVLLLLGSMNSAFSGGIIISAEEVSGTEETAATITESPTELLYEQATKLFTDEGKTSPTTSDDERALTQTASWRVASKTPTAADYSDTKYIWLRTNNSDTVDTRYGHSTWSYTTPYIGPAYKVGDTSKKVLTALLRPRSNDTGDRYNAFMSLYYIAETSGEFNLTDNIGGFTVRSSAASGYEVYVTVLADGEEIFKSQALTRVNRIAKFEGDTFYLEEGQKLEINFEYEYTAETYSGDISIDFDPQITLVDEYVKETPVLQGTGDISEYLYNDIMTHEGSGVFTVTQTSPWRVQSYASSKWSDCAYCQQSSVSGSNYLHVRYMHGSSNSQHANMGVRYYNSKLGNPKVIWTLIPFNKSKRPMRLAYTAEADGTYTLSDRYNVFTSMQGTLVYYEVYAYVTVNGERIWQSDETLRQVGDTITFNPIQVSLNKGDVLTITFDYKVRSDLAEDVTAETGGMFYIQFAPELSYLPPAVTEEYSIVDSFKSVFDEVLATEPTANVSGTLTQNNENWSFKYGTSFEGLTNMTNYSLNPDSTWGEMRLHGNTTATGDWPGIKYGTGTKENYGLMIHYRNRISGGEILSNGYHYNFAYNFKATRQGVHVLDEATFGYNSFYDDKIDAVLRIYKNSELIYTSKEIDSTVTSTVIPQINFMLNIGDELTFYFDRIDADTTLGYNYHSGYSYIPNITFHKDGVAVSKTGYLPEQNTRYYAEDLTVPSLVSAYVNTSAVVPGNIIDSDEFGIEILANGNIAVNYLNGETEKQILFPVNVKGNWNKVTVAYDTANSVWNCSINDIETATVEDTDFVAGGNVEKLYVGASADSYNNGSFEGEIAELILSGDSEIATWTLTDITTEENLIAETVTAKSDCSETSLTFPNKNHRLDLYETFEAPVSTFEAWVRLKTDYVDGRSAGRLLGNSYNYPPYAQLNIIANGQPQLYAYDGTNSATVTFDVDIRSDEFVHLAITADTTNGIYKCFIDGVLADTVESSMVIPAGTRPYLISGDYFYNNTPVNFEGDLAGVTLYSDVRTEAEIIEDMYGETDLADEALLGKWSLADKEDGLTNQKGDGNDFHPFWEDQADSTVDESYGDYSTFVFIPDTQNFTQSQGATGLNSISDWILNNKESENIVGVIGLGDITNKNTNSQWQAAKEAFDRLKGEIPYVFVQGNHDIGSATNDADGNTVYRNTENMNTYFPLNDWKPYLSGYYEEGKIDNMYLLTKDNKGIKYMLLGLEFQPRDEVLEWANEIVAAHPNYNVIVSTHGYQDYNYYTQEQTYITSNGYESIVGTDTNTGDKIWEKFVSKHSNITTVVCGHVYHEDIHVTAKTGDNGNTVTEIIANAQTTDALMRMSGTIMILRVSEDGTKANVNYYSPYHDHYLKDLNQFEMDWNTVMPDGNVAIIGGVGYATLQDAINTANTDDEIIITENISLDSAVVVDKAVTINLNGFNITSQNNVFDISADVTVTGTGTVTAGENSDIFTLGETANLTVTGGSYTNYNPAAKEFDYVAADCGVKGENGIYTVDTSFAIADTDTDGNATATDLTYLRNKIMGDTVDDKYFDINGDGSFNAVDIVKHKKIIAH